ncbi:MAG: hypothetical protein HGA25_04340 [Clostridiales bacterium]|nr:hypothetical protein [Clostridiales bacterium]
MNDCQVDTDLELLFPDNYIRNVSERVRLYRELDNIETEEKLLEFEQQYVLSVDGWLNHFRRQIFLVPYY